MSDIILTAVDNGSKSVTLTATQNAGPFDPVWPDGTEIFIKGSRMLATGQQDDWLDVGTIEYVTDTDLTATLPAYGSWLFLAHAPDEEAISNPFHLAVVNDEDDVFEQCHQDIAAQIVRLNLPDIETRVHQKLLPTDIAGVVYPCVFVVSHDGNETVEGEGTNATESVGHPVKIVIATRASVLEESTRQFLVNTRGRIRRTFSKARLPNVPKCRYTTVDQGGPKLQEWTHPQNQGNAFYLACTILTVRCHTREFRGFGQ